MNISYYIARRYVVSRKSRNVVNIISAVALLGVIVGTTALVVVLSIFNGFDVLIQSFFSVFDPEIKITIAEGKTFDATDPIFQTIKSKPDVIHYCEVVEEIAHFRYEERQQIAYIKGVDDEYIKMCHLADHIFDGKPFLTDKNVNYAILGEGLAQNIGASINNLHTISISVPKKGKNVNMMANPFLQRSIYMSGSYAVGQEEVDNKYALIPLSMARELLDAEGKVSSIELGLKPGSDVKKIQSELKRLLGSKYKVQNRYQQHESYYKVTKSEQFFAYIILSFILVIACFNLASSIAMLILDKKKDINILASMGMTRKRLSFIFLFEGWIISGIGAVIGLVLGILICMGQEHFGWLKFPGNLAVEFYPVELRVSSLIIIFITVLAIGAAASWLPVKFLPAKFFQLQEE